ncbi:MAG: amidohydrolase [Sphingobacteriales bacterium]|nr:amidohydrolase [Sphingobacteriales bacterium]
MIKKCMFTLSLGCLLSLACGAQSVQSEIEQKASKIQSSLVEWRRHLHQHPELSNREYNTAAYIASYLKQLGLEVSTGIANTGVVAILKGNKPGPVMALRADMDALPVKERVKLAYASVDSAEYLGQRVPVMHACGHDAHVAMLMGTAAVLSTMKKDIAGTVKFIFQPAEEGAPGTEEGGALLMVKQGVMDNPKVDVVFGMHIESWFPAGEIRYKPGAFMASADWFSIKVTGKSAHGAQPWQSVDPIVISAQIIEGLQNIISRQMDLTKAPVVITVGKIQGGIRNNIIPEQCVLDGTIRTLDSKMQEDVHQRIRQTAEKIAEASNAKAEVSFDTRTLVTYNNPELVAMMIPSLQKAAGTNNVTATDWVTGGEDFSYYGTKAPAFFFYFGGMPAGTETKNAPSHHTPDFMIDDSKLYVGVKTFCQLIMDYPNLIKK